MTTLETNAATIEAAITQLDVNLESARTQTPYQWAFRRGSATIYLALRPANTAQRQSNLALFAYAHILPMPADAAQQSRVMQWVLEMNFRMVMERFAIYQNNLYLLAGQWAADMQTSEIATLLTELSSYADMYDDELKQMLATFTTV